MIGAMWIGACVLFVSSTSFAGAQLDLARADVQSLPEISTFGGTILDANAHNIYTKIFGGVGGVYVKKYFEERIQFLAEPGTVSVFADKELPAPPKPDREPTEEEKALEKKSKDTNGAMSISGVIWFTGLTNDAQMGVKIGDSEPFEINGSRPGIMLLGPMYTDEIKIENSTKVQKMSRPYRQSILLHEARHADCTGGVTKLQVEVMRLAEKANKPELTMTILKGSKCLHMHKFCTVGPFAGIPACDDEPYGAYGIQYFFLASQLIDARAKKDVVLEQELKAEVIDTLMRFMDSMSPEQLEKFATGALEEQPDMSSSGVIQ